jgi:hypothetical protein
MRAERDSFDCHLRSPGVRGSPRQGCPLADKAAAAPHGPAKARPRLPGDQSRLRAVKRATVGGWMTARWSGVFHEGSAETPRSQDPQLGRRRVSHGNRQRSPKVVLLRVLVTRTSVVETNSRHLGDARKWSREAKRAATPSDGEGCRPWTGSTAVHLAEGCPAMQRAKAR